MDEPEFVFAPVHATRITHEGDHDYEEALTPACDFCLDTRVKWEYPCATFWINEIDFGSADEWLACEACSERIEAGDFGGLSARSARSWQQRMGPMSAELLDAMGAIQHGFFDHRTGPRKSIETEKEGYNAND